MNRVIFLNRFFFPDHSATSQLLSDLAFHLAAGGTDTHVITSRQLYDEPDAQLPSNETVHDVHIHRGGPGCLNRFSASISGASARVRLPGGVAAG
jgi:hypothetical protein